ncbi:MAG TPA: hypothetical protein VIV60_31920 [Polyangiaceae bacterium]
MSLFVNPTRVVRVLAHGSPPASATGLHLPAHAPRQVAVNVRHVLVEFETFLRCRRLATCHGVRRVPAARLVSLEPRAALADGPAARPRRLSVRRWRRIRNGLTVPGRRNRWDVGHCGGVSRVMQNKISALTQVARAARDASTPNPRLERWLAAAAS